MRSAETYLCLFLAALLAPSAPAGLFGRLTSPADTDPYPQDRWAFAGDRYFEVGPQGDLLTLSPLGLTPVPLPEGTRRPIRQVVSDGRLVAARADGGAVAILDIRIGGSWHLLEPGRDTRQIALEDGTLWLLEESGKLWTWTVQDPRFQLVDEARHTRRIVAVGQAVWMLDSAGALWRWKRGRVEELASGPFVVGQEYTGTGALHLVVRDRDQLFRVRPGAGRKRHATLEGHLYFLDPGRGLVRFDPITSHGEVLDSARDSVQVAVTARHIYLLKSSGNVWRGHRRPGQPNWARVDDGVATRMIAASGKDLWVLKDSGRLWKKPDDGDWTPVADLGEGPGRIPVQRARTTSPHGQPVMLVATPQALRVWVVGEAGRDAPAAPEPARMTRFHRLHAP